MTDKAIFFDERKRRWRRTRRVLAVTGVLSATVLSLFFFAVFHGPDLPQIPPGAERPRLYGTPKIDKSKLASAARERMQAFGKLFTGSTPLRIGFYVSDDRASLRSLVQHHHEIDLVVPVLLHAASADGTLSVTRDDELAAWLRNEGSALPFLPLVDNFDGTAWRGHELGDMLTNTETRRTLVSALERHAVEHHTGGLVVDFEEVPPAAQAGFRAFIHELAERLHPSGRKLMVALPARDRDYDYAFFGAETDAVILMNYDQHWESSTPGPIAAQSWYTRNLTAALESIPPRKLVAGVANYAYDWPEAAPGDAAGAAESLTVPEALANAQGASVGLTLDPASLNPHFNYVDATHRQHRVWLLDAVTAHNQIHAAERAGVLGTALWRLGSEDRTFWSLWRRDRSRAATLAALEDVPPAEDPLVVGEGDVWRITQTPQTGRRHIRHDPATDNIVEERFTAYPHPYRVQQQGDAPGKIALTFDDGPDPRFTPLILDALRAEQAHATFFVTGIAAYQWPRLLERAYAEGHEIGNHTYTHTGLDEISSSQLRLELTLTQRLVQSRLGASTLLFRPPYGVDDQAVSSAGLERLRAVQQLGYVIVGSQIDSNDWGDDDHESPPAADEIVETVLEQAHRGDGHVVLLHDGGGDRQSTVAAVPRIIERLRAEGFELTSISALLGQTRDDTMPRLTPTERWMAEANRMVFVGFRGLRLVIAAVCLSAIGLLGLRTLAIAILAFRHKRRPVAAVSSDFQPPVSVLIPAYDEEKVIVSTLRSVLASDYPRLEVLVIDDGSRDATAALVREHFGNDPRVCVLQQPNQGKSGALNLGVAEAKGEILVTIDADTAIEPATISKLVRHFIDAKIAGVAGNTKVANRDHSLTRWQALEYISGQNLEKRAFDILNCITVVPGAVGAWRAEAIRFCGGFSKHTVAEDTDLTLTIRRHGWRIVYDDEAVGRTIAPETSAALIRQRFRWTFGTLQALWKHRDAFGRERYGTLGRVALPHILLFQILLPLFCPVVDLLFFGSLLIWALARAHFGPFLLFWTPGDMERALAFFAVFMLIDLTTSLVAFALEEDEDWSLLISLPFQRFYYRQLMDVVLFRAILSAVQGRAVGWGRVGPRTAWPAPRPSEVPG